MLRFYIFIIVFIMQIQISALGFEQWKNSPNNWNNNEINWQNDSLNWKNSPMNWQNNPMNPNANLIYDNNGNAKGYFVPKSNGTGVNVFDFEGNRQGYYNY